jgi:hypothetical protein
VRATVATEKGTHEPDADLRDGENLPFQEGELALEVN